MITYLMDLSKVQEITTSMKPDSYNRLTPSSIQNLKTIGLYVIQFFRC